jgi:branched-chain amino acid transport system substrate-binding protein
MHGGFLEMPQKTLLFQIAIFLISLGCGDGHKRGVYYNTPKSDEISIGVAYPISLNVSTHTHFAKGLEFAVNTVNNNGGVLGKKLGAVVRDDGNNANIAMQIAQSFCDHGITAVIGHWSTDVSYYTQDIYERNKVVMLTPKSTGLILFENKFDYVFRMTGNNQVVAGAVASYMAEKGFRNVVIFFSEDVFGADLATVFEKELNAGGIRVIDRVTSVTPLNIGALLSRWRAFGCDGLIMAASYPEYVEPIITIRRSGSKLPIFGGNTFERLAPDDLPCDSLYDGLYVATLNKDNLDAEFLEEFRAEYGHGPDAAAVDAYEAVTLLKDAIEATTSIDGTAIAGYLSSLKDYNTVSGVRTYNPGTQEFDGYSVHVVPLKSVVIGINNKNIRQTPDGL